MQSQSVAVRSGGAGSHTHWAPPDPAGVREGLMPRDLVGLPPTLTVGQAARLCGIGRNAAYEAVAAGELPALRIGRRWVVPTVPLLRMLGVGVADDVKLAAGSQA